MATTATMATTAMASATIMWRSYENMKFAPWKSRMEAVNPGMITAKPAGSHPGPERKRPVKAVSHRDGIRPGNRIPGRSGFLLVAAQPAQHHARVTHDAFQFAIVDDRCIG